MNDQSTLPGFHISHCAAAGDGGSLSLNCLTPDGSTFHLLFTQSANLENPNPQMLPGRIYLNEQLVGLKSEEEQVILMGLSNFSLSEELLAIDTGIKETLSNIFGGYINFFGSDLSLEIKKKVDENLSN